MGVLKNILLTGLVIDLLIGAKVIIDPYKGLNYDEITAYHYYEVDHTIEIQEAETNAVEAEIEGYGIISAYDLLQLEKKRIINYLKYHF